MDFVGKAKRIEDRDIPRIAAKIGVGEDEIHAFMDVEAAGSGFDSKGRPKMLFEPHVFWRNLPPSLRDKAVNEGVAYPKWKRGYPKDSYPRLEKAIAIHETAALKSASWGLGQILGENHRLVGYDSPKAMVEAFMDDEEKHLEAIVDFLIANKLDDDLRAHRWDAVARGYNGPGYATHGYHTKMAKAYAKWAKIKDTPAEPAPKKKAEPTGFEKGNVSIRRVQEALRTLGYPEVGFVDGKMGNRTRAAIAAFQINEGLKPTGELTNELFVQIMKAEPRKIAPERANLQVKDIADSPGVKIGQGMKILGGLSAIFGVGGGAFDAFTEDRINQTVATVDRLNGVVQTISDVGPWALGVVVGLTALGGGYLIIQHLLQGSRQGRHV